MTLKNDGKSEEELTCRFKIDINNLMNFDSRTRKSQKFRLNGLLLTKIYNVSAKKVNRSYMLYFMTLECDAKFEEKLTCGLENDMRNLANFHQST